MAPVEVSKNDNKLKCHSPPGFFSRQQEHDRFQQFKTRVVQTKRELQNLPTKIEDLLEGDRVSKMTANCHLCIVNFQKQG